MEKGPANESGNISQIRVHKQKNDGITISFNSLDEQTRGPSYWKFNSSLVDDENYVLAINQKIPEWLEEFKEVIDKRVL